MYSVMSQHYKMLEENKFYFTFVGLRKYENLPKEYKT